MIQTLPGTLTIKKGDWQLRRREKARVEKGRQRARKTDKTETERKREVEKERETEREKEEERRWETERKGDRESERRRNLYVDREGEGEGEGEGDEEHEKVIQEECMDWLKELLTVVSCKCQTTLLLSLCKESNRKYTRTKGGPSR